MDSQILILGGSLAGLSCAIRLRQWGYSPLVLEKCNFPRKKLCGEFLGPDALHALQSLGILEKIHGMAFGPVEQTIFYNRQGQGIKVRHAWIDSHYPYGLALSRERLDTTLAEYARGMGVEILEGCRVVSPIIKTDDETQKFQVNTHKMALNGAVENPVYFSRYLVDATGRSGKLALTNGDENLQRKIASNSSYKKIASKKRVGIQCHAMLQKNSQKKDLSMFLFPGGYGGIQPVSDCEINICMLLDAPLSKRMHLSFPEFLTGTIGQNPAAEDQLRNAEQISEFCTTADVNLWGEDVLGMGSAETSGLLRIGDASVTVDPFTGSGMAHALETGLMAAQSIHLALRNSWTPEQLGRYYQRQYRPRFKARLNWMRYCRPWLEREWLQRLAWPVLPSVMPWLARNLR